MLRRLRESRGLTEAETAERLGGYARRPTLTATEISRWELERDGRTPGPYWLAQIAGYFDVPLVVLQQARAASRAARVSAEPAQSGADALARLALPENAMTPGQRGVTRGRAGGGAESSEDRRHRPRRRCTPTQQGPAPVGLTDWPLLAYIDQKLMGFSSMT